MEEVLFSDLPKKFQELNRNVKFAGVVALTRMAMQGRLDVQESAKKNFTLRNRWVLSGIRYNKADINQPEPFSEVFTKDDNMYDHEEGGLRDLKDPGYIHVGTRKIFGIPDNKPIPRAFSGANLDWTQTGSKSKSKIKGLRTFKSMLRKSDRAALQDSPGLLEGSEKIGRFVVLNDGSIRLMMFEQRGEPVRIKKRPWFKPAMDASYDKNFQRLYDAAWNQYVVDRL